MWDIWQLERFLMVNDSRQDGVAMIDRDPDVGGVWERQVLPWVVLLCCVGVLGLASYLKVDESGMGTHTQLGMDECGMVTNFHMPCVTCGMTTTFTMVAHGRYLDGFLNQPAGFVLALMTAIMVWVSGYSIYRKVGLGCYLAGTGKGMLWFLGVVMVFGWGYKIMLFKGVFDGMFG